MVCSGNLVYIRAKGCDDKGDFSCQLSALSNLQPFTYAACAIHRGEGGVSHLF